RNQRGSVIPTDLYFVVLRGFRVFVRFVSFAVLMRLCAFRDFCGCRRGQSCSVIRMNLVQCSVRSVSPVVAVVTRDAA
ncbi:MAG TPA: hypothetical protein VFA59_04965, partial [Vicinamibacterales bacterium]|nr:hypothetical protein [Vicinamibacterales bacterium]